MIGEKRREEIHRKLGRAGYVEARQLAVDLGVDVSTIRRDLDAMARSGLVQRTHGGALPIEGGGDTFDLPYELKAREQLAEKEAIAAHAGSFVDHGASVVLDSGSTTFALARAIASRRNLTVATNDLHIAHFFATRGGARVLVTGGQLIDSVFTLVGPTTLAGLTGLHVDWAFMGADAVDVEVGVTNVNTVEVPVKQAMLAAAARSVLVADSTKFGHRALAAVTKLGAFEQVVTDEGLPLAARNAYGDRLVCVPVASETAQ